MNKDLTEIVFILDESGSMSDLVSDTIGGFNSLIEKQKKIEGPCLVSTILFNDRQKVILDRCNLSKVKKMTESDYCPSGRTALIDALGDSINHIKNIYKYARKEDIPGKTMFVITTDGMENASRKYSSSEVKKMIEKQRNKHDWEFVFLAANIDAVETAKSYGISSHKAYNYVNDSSGIADCYTVINDHVAACRYEPFSLRKLDSNRN